MMNLARQPKLAAFPRRSKHLLCARIAVFLCWRCIPAFTLTLDLDRRAAGCRVNKGL